MTRIFTDREEVLSCTGVCSKPQVSSHMNPICHLLYGSRVENGKTNGAPYCSDRSGKYRHQGSEHERLLSHSIEYHLERVISL